MLVDITRPACSNIITNLVRITFTFLFLLALDGLSAQYCIDGSYCPNSEFETLFGNDCFPDSTFTDEWENAQTVEFTPGNQSTCEIIQVWGDIAYDSSGALQFYMGVHHGNGGQATFRFYFNADCDSLTGQEYALGRSIEQCDPNGNNGNDTCIFVGGADYMLELRPGNNTAIDLFEWDSIQMEMVDVTTAGEMIETGDIDGCGGNDADFFEFSLPLLELFDPCENNGCGAIELTTSISNAGNSINSEFCEGISLELVLPVNQPPTAVIDPVLPCVYNNQEVCLFAGNSIDPDTNIILFQWDTAYDGITFDVDTVGEEVCLVFPAGMNTVALRVTDFYECQDTTTGANILEFLVKDTANRIECQVSNIGSDTCDLGTGAFDFTISPADVMLPIDTIYDYTVINSDLSDTVEVGTSSGELTRISSLSAGNYTLVVADSDGCQDTCLFEILAEFEVPDLTTMNDSLCVGVMVDLSSYATLGDPIIDSFTIHSVFSDADLNQNPLMNFIVEILESDTFYVRAFPKAASDDCFVIDTIILAAVSLPTPMTADTTICNGEEVDLADLVSGMNITYHTTKAGAETVGGLTDIATNPNTYTMETEVYVRDTTAEGCFAIDSLTITAPAALSCTISLNSEVTCNSCKDAVATVTGVGGVGPYTQVWSNGDMRATADTLGLGIQFVTVTDANDCETTCQIEILPIPVPPDTIIVPPGDTCLDAMTFELPEVERVEVCGTDVDITFTTGMDSCVTVTPIDPDHFGLDTVCIILCDSIAGYEICDTTTIIIVTPPPPDTIIVPPGDTCLDAMTFELPEVERVEVCGTDDDIIFTTGMDSCVTVTPVDPDHFGLDTVCIVLCDTISGIEFCDTTTIIIVTPPPPDTIIVPPGDTCLDAMTFELPEVERVEVCGTDVDIIFTTGMDSCVTVTPVDPDHFGLDTVCIVLCDTISGIEFCDTTTIIIVTPPPPDTIIVPPGDTCLDAMTFELPEVERVEVCGTDDDIIFTTGMDSCVTVTPVDPDHFGLDTVCIVLCDTISGIEFCDTTTIIIVTPPPPDTIIVPPGDTCLDAMTFELPEVERVEVCGTDDDIIFTTGMDSCVTVTPVDPDHFGLDTVCIVLCDTISGIEFCDTTTIIIVTPPPPDTIIVPPGDTCLDAMTFELPEVERVEVCGTDDDIIFTTGMDSCVTVTPVDPDHFGLDTVCIVLCDTISGIEFCDTTTIIIVTPPPPDTIIVPPGDTCLDAMTFELPEVERVEVCGTDVDIIFTTGMDSCVTVTPVDPDHFGLDTVCIVLCDTISGIEFCDTTTIIIVTPPPPDTIIVPPGDTCLDAMTFELPEVERVEVCGTDDDIIFTTGMDSCVTVTPVDPDHFGLDTVCIVLCDTISGIEFCDTTTIIIVTPPPPDTIIVPPGDTCLDAMTFELPEVERVEVCGTDDDIIFTTGMDSCVTVTPIDPDHFGLDTVCIVLCDTIGGIEFCDTTTIIIVTPPPPDTIIVPPGDTCLDAMTFELPEVERVEVCGTDDDIIFTTGIDSCVTVTPVDPNYGGVDTVCIVLCDTIGGIELCDTTVIIVVTIICSTTNNSNVSCNGEADGSATVNPIGGVAPYTYAWSNGDDRVTADTLRAGSHTVTVTEANGFTTTCSVMITEPVILTSTITQINIACDGEAEGSATVNPVGGTSPYTYLWDNGDDRQTADTLTGGIHIVTVTDANACESIDSLTIMVNPLPTPMTTDTTICSGEEVDLGDLVSGMNITYHTTKAGAETAGGLTDVATNPTTYTMETAVYVRDTTAEGCFAIDSLTIMVNPLPTPMTTDTTICSGEEVDLDDLVSGMNITYHTTKAGAETVGGLTDVATNPTTYTMETAVYVRDTTAEGCFAIDSLTIMVNPLPTPMTTDTTICSGEEVDLGDLVSGMNITYHTTKAGAETAGGLTDVATNPTTYTMETAVYVRDTTAEGCFAIDSLTIMVNPLPTPMTTDTTICSGEEVDLGDLVSGMNISYHTTKAGAETAGGLTDVATNPTTYTMETAVYVRDTTAEGCFAIDSLTIMVNPLPTPMTTDTTICSGEEVDLGDLVSGMNISYHTTKAGAETAGGLTDVATNPTTYTMETAVYVRDTTAEGCFAIDSLTIMVNPLPTPMTTDTTICSGEEVDLGDLVSGMNITYHTTKAGAESAGGLTDAATNPTTYTMETAVYVRDTTAEGCFAIDSLTIMVNPLPTPMTTDTTICSGEEVDLADLVSGMNITYHTTKVGAETVGGLTDVAANPTTYTMETAVYVRDTTAEGCFAIDSLTIMVNPLPTPMTTDTTICSGEEVDLADLVSGMNITYHTTKVGAETVGGLTDVATNPISYTMETAVYVRDTTAEGCFAIDSLTIMVNPLPTPMTTDTTICSGEEVDLADLVSGMNISYHTTKAGAETVGGLTDVAANPTTYTMETAVYVRDTTAEGCFAIDSLTIMVNPLPTPMTADTTICSGEEVDLADLVSGMNISYHTSLTGAETIGGLTDVATNPNIYTDSTVIYIRDTTAFGCYAIDSFEIQASKYALDIQVLLEGAYTANATMQTLLNDFGYLPGQIPLDPFVQATPAGHPYEGAPWNFTDFTLDYFGDGMGQTPYDSDVVDYIYVSILEGGINVSTDVVWTCVGLLKSDGSVQFPEDCGPICVDPLAEQYVFVQHRNHLPVLDTLELEGVVLRHNFMIEDSYVDFPIFPVIGQKQIALDFLMATANGGQMPYTTEGFTITSDDQTQWTSDQNNEGYFLGDYNMNGNTASNDETLWKGNQNIESEIPR